MDEDKFPCQIAGCMAVFRTEEEINNHWQAAHEDPLPFKCNITPCSEAFSTARGLRTHKAKLHRDDMELPFRCEAEGCGKAYQFKGGLATHMVQKHPGEQDPKPFKCPDCDKAYPALGNLKKHQANVHQIFRCSYRNCNVESASGWDLHVHRAVTFCLGHYFSICKLILS